MTPCYATTQGPFLVPAMTTDFSRPESSYYMCCLCLRLMCFLGRWARIATMELLLVSPGSLPPSALVVLLSVWNRKGGDMGFAVHQVRRFPAGLLYSLILSRRRSL